MSHLKVSACAALALASVLSMPAQAAGFDFNGLLCTAVADAKGIGELMASMFAQNKNITFEDVQKAYNAGNNSCAALAGSTDNVTAVEQYTSKNGTPAEVISLSYGGTTYYGVLPRTPAEQENLAPPL